MHHVRQVGSYHGVTRCVERKSYEPNVGVLHRIIVYLSRRGCKVCISGLRNYRFGLLVNGSGSSIKGSGFGDLGYGVWSLEFVGLGFMV